jgi:DUF4097 and DUF4098 domain-containing protein YvlB
MFRVGKNQGNTMKRITQLYLLLVFSFSVSVMHSLQAITAKYEEIKNYEHSFNDNGKLTIHNTDGTLTIKGWDKNVVSVQMCKVATTQNALDATHVHIAVNNATATIKTVKPENYFGLTNQSNASVNYVIYLPKAVVLNVHNTSGLAQISGLSNCIDIKTTSGAIEIDGDVKVLHARSTSGNIQILANTKTLTARATSGSINVQGSGDTIELETNSGSISMQGIINKIYACSKSGSVEMRGQGKNITMKTTSGKIKAYGHFDYVDSTSTSGSISIDKTKKYQIKTKSGKQSVQLWK